MAKSLSSKLFIIQSLLRNVGLIKPILNLVTRMPVMMASFFFAFLAIFPYLPLSLSRIFLGPGSPPAVNIAVIAYAQISSQPQTTSIYNDYVVNLARHAKGGGCAVG